jgi:type I restriction enzyme R subunit
MTGHRGTESDFELTTIERLEQLGYTHIIGIEIDRPHKEVVFKDSLGAAFRRRYPDLPDASVKEAVARLSRPQGADLMRRNLDFHQLIARGFEVPVEKPNGAREFRHVHPIDWENPEANEFLVVNQLPVHGKNDRRPDIVIYVNGLPLALFELKNPWHPNPTVEHALNQIAHYRNDIPQVFEFNAVTVVSDGLTTLHGMWSASMEWFAPWKSIDGLNIEKNTTGSMKALVEGLFPKERFLAYIRDFIVFEQANDRIEKKGAKYHQFFAVQEAVASAKRAFGVGADKRLGVIWHTTGSGKSLSMAFLVSILRRMPELKNPTIVVQVDATDLDNQLYDQFVAARALVGDARHAGSIEELRSMLQGEGGELIFSTTQKFQLKKELGPDGKLQMTESEHPVLSTRDNIVVIADEAHRSQYGFLKGYARYLREALPNAKFLGFTGTPVSFSGADTVEVFGELIHTYDMAQSQDDRATVPIYYEPRQIKLHLSPADIDAALAEVAKDEEPTNLERKKSRWAALAAAAGAKERIEQLAKDLLQHFTERTATLAGKAMIVCMTRENCVRLYNALTALKGCPEIKIVMTGDLGKDPEVWSKAGHITTKAQREAIKQRMIDPDDPLALVIVCDMWLTGTDIPCLHTLYVDKPMRGHSIIQAISRVNRVFRDKPHGLVVDYIGIADDLRDAANTYTKGGGKGEPAPSVTEAAKPVFFDALKTLRGLLPDGIDYGDWRKLSLIAIEDRYSLVYGHLTESDEVRDVYLRAESKLSQAFLLVRHDDECRPYADEIIFCQRVRNQLQKTKPGTTPKTEVEKAVRDLVDEHVESEGVYDIFKAAGIEKADLSILDDNFLQTFKDKPLPNLRLRLLEKLLADELTNHERKNLAKAKSFREMLEKTLQKYHNRLIDAAAVIKAMLEIKKDIEQDAKRAEALGLSEEELAFYDAVAATYQDIYSIDFLRDLVHEVVQSVKRNLKVDWTAPHREDVKAGVRAAVKRALIKKGVAKEHFDTVLASVMAQAEVAFARWPLAA